MTNFHLIQNSDKAYLFDVAKKTLELRRESESRNESLEFWVITPNYLSIETLKEQFFEASKSLLAKDSVILPRITTSDNYILSEMFGDQGQQYSTYEQVMIMSEIIYKYEAQKYSQKYRLSEALEIGAEFVQLFWRLKKNNININEVDKWVDEDIAQHWWELSSFLQFCFNNFEKKVLDGVLDGPLEDSLGGLEIAEKPVLQPKLDRFLVVVGQLENLAYFLDYVKEFNIPHIIIPPPIPALTQSKQAQSSQSPDNLYFQKYYGDYIKTSALSNKPAQLSTNEIQLFEFHDIFEEAEYLANFAHQKIANQDIDSEQKDLVIITNNHFLENILASKLRNLGIPYNSSFGDKYSALDEASLIIALTRLKCEEGSIESFLSFISSKLISGHPDVDQFTKLIHAKSRFYENLGAITQDESLTAELPVIKELLGILDHFALSLEARVSKLLELTYRTFKRIYKLLNIQSKFGDAERIRSFMEDIISIDTLDFPIGLPEYFLLVQAMLSLKSVMPFDKSAKIYILNFEDSLLIDAAYVIFADFNQESVIKKDVDDDWIAKKIFSKMLKEERSDNFFKSLYYVNAKAQAATNGRTNLLFTRSIFNDGVLNEQCPILDYINHSKVEFKVSIPYAQDKAPEDVEISLEALPNVLYATNVEMLIRNPYGFYARKILKLTRKQNLLAKMAASDFGSIIHEVIEVISLPPYAEAASPGLQQDISSILEEICRRRGVPSFYVSLWTRSAEYIASEVIALNKEVYNKGGEIFVEVEGVSTVGLSGGVIESVIEPVIELRAIADRIEVYDDKIKIMDFKTGVPPSKSELMSGISPQLIIEAMIYMAGGFKGITYDESRSIELVFLKVNTRAPYIEEKIIKVTKEDVATHKAALIRLLEYYYKNDKASFELEIHELLAPKYDEYSHLRRC